METAVLQASPPGGPQTETSSVTVVVPTKNRPDSLRRTLSALLDQSLPAAELIVVDQSDVDGGRAVAELVASVPPARRPRLVYVWDRAIHGAAAARNAGLDRASRDVVAFCDDDVVPEATVLERLVAHYRRAPHVAGIAPVIVNYEVPSALRRLQHHVFCRGPFRDDRQLVYWSWSRYAEPTLVPVRMFTGAMMSFRRAALGSLRHDPRYRGASTGEDVDLCWSLGRRGGRLAIATDAHIVHDRAPRPARRFEALMITSWAFLYDKHVDKTPRARLTFAWFIVGVFVGSLMATLRERTFAPVRSAASGLRSVCRDYAETGFLAERRDATPCTPPENSTAHHH